MQGLENQVEQNQINTYKKNARNINWINTNKKKSNIISYYQKKSQYLKHCHCMTYNKTNIVNINDYVNSHNGYTYHSLTNPLKKK